MTIQLPLHRKRPQGEHLKGDARPEALGGESTSASLDLQNLRVGDLAKRTNKTVRALHLYEEHGLLTPAQRSSGGYRLYGRDAEL
ncbi:MAG: MerR family DNA-binding transcriptional regulator, partial [Polyangiales bacterium]